MQETPLKYDGKPGSIFGIWLINLIFRILTLGIYTFWGKVRMRRYVWKSFSLGGDRFLYTGKGKELWKGFRKAVFVYFLLCLPIIVLDIIEGDVFLYYLFALPFVFLAYAGWFMAIRYRYSRTLWRGIRGRLAGSASYYATLSMVGILLNIVTLGFASPYTSLRLQAYLAQNSYFGTTPIRFTARYREAFVHYLQFGILFVAFSIDIAFLVAQLSHVIPMVRNSITVPAMIFFVLCLFLLPFFYCRYRATLNRLIFENMQLDEVTFRCTQTGGNLLRLWIGNILLIFFTLGLATPLVIHRRARYLASTLIVVGNFDALKARQSQEKLGSSGEGLDSILGDSDVGFA